MISLNKKTASLRSLASSETTCPEGLNETAYALACDVAASDGHIYEGELRLLEEMRYELQIDRLHAAAIERGSRARHMTLAHVS